ncbi:unnamed protein product [Soboliphyme baturini]|uniref:PID domain-containing protein n=1 Tax=Soboliphyme baturini TaxID=241478 RepID=A0A183IPH5_9BILA|nr:unnamed protein product [Soboliphyme baturini]
MNKSMNRVVRFVQNTAMVLRRSPPSFDDMTGHGHGGRSASLGSSISASAAMAATFNKSWIHPPDALMYGRVEYTVKFLGEVAVGQSKGTDVIKEAIQKLQFNLQLRRAQGYKLPKVELHISVEHVNIVDYRSKQLLFQYPLHRISFCADDKHDKRVFAFIAKRSADSTEHNCFVFLCDKLAEDITLTVGEAFDLAYRRFVESNGKELELRKQLILLRKRINELEIENSTLKEHVRWTHSFLKHSLRHTWESFDDFVKNTPVSPSIPNSPIPPTPIRFANDSATRGKSTEPAGSTKEESGSGDEPGITVNGATYWHGSDLYDPYFNPREGERSPEFDKQIKSIERHLTDLRDGFKHGLAFANDDFHIDVKDIDAADSSSLQNLSTANKTSSG